LRSFQFLLSCFQFLANLSCLILSSLNLSTGVSGYRSSSWLRRLGLLSFSLSLRCLILGLISFCLGISQLLLVFCSKFRFNRLAYWCLIYSTSASFDLVITIILFNLLLQFVILILELS